VKDFLVKISQIEISKREKGILQLLNEGKEAQSIQFNFNESPEDGETGD
jgi:hypothetical protein